MIVALRFRRPFRAWHLRLMHRLEADGHTVQLEPRGKRRHFGLALALWLERRLYGVACALREPVGGALCGTRGVPDLVVALDGTQDDAALVPCFDGETGDQGLLRAVLRGMAPRLSIHDTTTGAIVADGLPALERPDCLAASIDHVLAPTIDLVMASVRSHGSKEGAPVARDDTTPKPDVSPLGFVLRHLRRKIVGRLRGRSGGDVHWRIGYRSLDGDPVARRRAWPEDGFTMLPDDGAGYRADPFVFDDRGRRFVFMEVLPRATGKGVIAVGEVRNGIVDTPRVVLEQPGHLSYPIVFHHGDAIYMLPETSAARCLRLFRADPFPDRWVADRILFDDVVAADATPIVHDGRHWLFASLAGDGGSTWDRLGLFHAPSPLGPWTAHVANPVLVDAGAARPGGAMWHEDGTLMRVAQDCRAGYGAGLAICRVDRLDLECYAQTVVAFLPAPDGARCAHTLNSTADFEVIDIGRSAAR